MGRNPLGVMEDPVKSMVVEALAVLGPRFLIRSVDVGWSVGELRVTVYLKPREEGETLSAWRIIEAEERIAEVLGLEPELSHSRVGVTPDGLLVLFFTYRVPGLRPPEPPGWG